MKNEIPNNVIQFPTFERVKQVINEKIDEQIEEADRIDMQKEECVELAHYCFQLMEQAITGNEFIDGFEDMDFLDINRPELERGCSMVAEDKERLFKDNKKTHNAFAALFGLPLIILFFVAYFKGL